MSCKKQTERRIGVLVFHTVSLKQKDFILKKILLQEIWRHGASSTVSGGR